MPNSDANVANIVNFVLSGKNSIWMFSRSMTPGFEEHQHTYMYNLHPSVLLFKPTVDSK